MSATPARNFTRLAAAIVIAAMVLSATLFVTLGSASTVTKTVAEITTTETTTLTSTSTQYDTVTSPGNASLLADCLSSEQVSVPWFGTITAKTDSPAVICVQLYDFNSTSLITVNTTELISILGSQPILGGGSESASGAANFTVVASRSQVVLGGPTNAGEGTVVAYTITAKPGASGTYTVGAVGWEVGSGPEPEACGGDNGYLIAGNGQPNYALVGGCITYSSTASSSFTIPGMSYNILSNYLYFRITNVTNSTQ